MFQWQCRYKFVHEFSEDYGRDTAVSLSMLWANKNFLGCSYPKKAEAQVANFPVPRKTELIRWLNENGYSDHFRTKEPARTTVKDSVTLKCGSAGTASTSSELTPAPSKSGRVGHLTGGSTNSPQTAGDSHSSSEESMPFETLTEQLDFLISSIRRQHDPSTLQKRKHSQEESMVESAESNTSAFSSPVAKRLLLDDDQVPDTKERVVESLAQKCICASCNGGTGTYPVQVLATICKSLNLGFSLAGYGGDGGSFVAEVYIDQMLMSKRASRSKEAAEDEAAREVLDRVADFQKANRKPPCYSKGVWSRIGDKAAPSQIDQPPRESLNSRLPRLIAEGQGFPEQGDRGGRRMMVDDTMPAMGSGIREKLLEFIHSDKQELVFTADLSLEEKKIVTELSEQHLLKHQNYGSTGSRHIIKKRIDSQPNHWSTDPEQRKIHY